MEKLKKINALLENMEGKLLGTEEEFWLFFITMVSAELKCEASTYFSVDESRKMLTFSASTGPNSEELKGSSFSYAGIAGWCASNKKDVLVKDTALNPLFTQKVDYATKFKTRSVMAFCCFYGGYLAGVAEFINPAGEGEFSEEDFEAVKILTASASKSAYINRLVATVRHLNDSAQSAINNLSGGFIGSDMDGKIIFFNPKAGEILGLGEEFIGKSYTELEKISPEIKEALKEVLSSGKIEKRKEFPYAREGKIVRIGYSTINIKSVDGMVTGAGIIFQDITGL